MEGSVRREREFRTVKVRSWEDYRRLVEGGDFRSWAFRGQADARWPLVSSLSRHLRYAGVHPAAWARQEERILRIFQRKSHHFLQHIPHPQDSFEWLALMQHHGAPTRLLDLTWSPYVAIFFALEHGAETAAVWAFNAGVLGAKGKVTLQSGEQLDVSEAGTWSHGSYERHYVNAQHAFVRIGEPRSMNRRLIAQSGTFAVPSRLERPLEEIIEGYAEPDDLLVKIEVDVAAVRHEAMLSLYHMNLTNATLFPDLDGLARSMAFELEYHWAFDPRTMVVYPGYAANEADSERTAP